MRRLHALIPSLLLAISAPAAADWLVTGSGATIETAGGWEVRGPVVVFKSTEGRLSSLRASEVDLDASRALTLAPPSPSAPVRTERPTPRPALVLTDADVRHVAANGAVMPSDPASADDGTLSQKSEEARIEVLSWQDRVDVEANALEIFGKLANRGSSLATQTRLDVQLLDDTGELLEVRRASLGEQVLQPGATVGFSARFPGSPGFTSVGFDVQSRGFRVRRPPTTADSASGPDQ